MSKVILIVTDSMGVGALPDAAAYGDDGADTFGHIAAVMTKEKNKFHIPNLRRLGIGNIDGVSFNDLACPDPMGAYGKMGEISKGKDTITGHWEIAGIYTDTPFTTCLLYTSVPAVPDRESRQGCKTGLQYGH